MFIVKLIILWSHKIISTWYVPCQKLTINRGLQVSMCFCQDTCALSHTQPVIKQMIKRRPNIWADWMGGGVAKLGRPISFTLWSLCVYMCSIPCRRLCSWPPSSWLGIFKSPIALMRVWVFFFFPSQMFSLFYLALVSYCRFRAWPTVRNGGNWIQQVCMAHEPDTPWHLHDWRIECRTACLQWNMSIEHVAWHLELMGPTRRPAKLLCKLAKAWASCPDSRESNTRTEYCSPILMLSLQPPHRQVLEAGINNLFCFLIKWFFLCVQWNNK